MDASPSPFVKGRSGGDRTSTSSQLRRSFVGRKSLSLTSFDSNKSTNIFFDSPEVSALPGQHCVQFLTLLPHQEKLFYLNLFQRKKQYSSNPISHIEHRTKSHVFMEISAFDSPVCRIRIYAKEKRNIERVLELFDEYCPVLLKYSNHQELTRVRQSLLPMGSSIFSDDIRQSSSNKLPTLRRVPSGRRRDVIFEKAKSAKPKVSKVATKTERADDVKAHEQSDDQDQDPSENAKDQKAEQARTVPKEASSEEARAVDKEKTLDSHLQSPSHASNEDRDADLEREKTLSSFDGEAVNNEASVLSAIESLIKSEPEGLSRPHGKSKVAEHRKSATSVEICQELENVVEGYLEREREKVEKLKMEAKAEVKTEQKVLDKFRALVRNSGKPAKKTRKEKEAERKEAERKEAERKEAEAKEAEAKEAEAEAKEAEAKQEMPAAEAEAEEEGDRGEVEEEEDGGKTQEVAAGDDKSKKRKRKRRKVFRSASGIRRDSRNK